MAATKIISERTLLKELDRFRDILLHYDFSEVDNLIFFDVSSLNLYLQTHIDNPFERQYNALEEILNKLIPYLPTRISNDTIDLITKLVKYRYHSEELIRKNVLFNLKMDFIDRVKNIHTEKEWQELITQCKKIRQEKALEKV